MDAAAGARIEPVPMSLIDHHGVRPHVHPSAFVADGAWLIGEVDARRGRQRLVQRGASRATSTASASATGRNVQDGAVIHVTQEDSGR